MIKPRGLWLFDGEVFKVIKLLHAFLVLTKVKELHGATYLRLRRLDVFNGFVVEFRVVLSDAEESFELIWLFNGWNHQQVLEVALENVPSINYLISSSTHRGPTTWYRHANTARDVRRLFELVKAPLSKLVTALRKLYAWILVYQWLMQLTEGSILLPHYPSLLSIKLHLNQVLDIASMINRIFL